MSRGPLFAFKASFWSLCHNTRLFSLFPLLFFSLQTSIDKKGWGGGQESEKSRVIYTLAPGGKDCKFLVKRGLHVFIGHLSASKMKVCTRKCKISLRFYIGFYTLHIPIAHNLKYFFLGQTNTNDKKRGSRFNIEVGYICRT